MEKFIIENDTERAWFETADKRTDKEILKAMQAQEPEQKWLRITRVPKDKHVCKYCYGLAEGTYEELLCQECREMFGHSLYSEL